MKMNNSKLLIASTGFVITSMMALPAHSEDSKDKSSNVSEIETVVKDLIAREPQIVENALKDLMQKREKESQENTTKMVKKYHNEIFNGKNDPFLGNAKAPVSLVVFMDPYCGYCRHLQKNLKEIMKERSDFKVIYKAFPILSQESKLAAEEELAANELGKFNDYHLALYSSDAKNRNDRLELAKSQNINVDKLKEYLPTGGKNTKADMIDKKLEANMKLGRELGINGTPAIIAGDSLISGAMEKDQLNQLIDIMKKEQGKA